MESLKLNPYQNMVSCKVSMLQDGFCYKRNNIVLLCRFVKRNAISASDSRFLRELRLDPTVFRGCRQCPCEALTSIKMHSSSQTSGLDSSYLLACFQP